MPASWYLELEHLRAPEPPVERRKMVKEKGGHGLNGESALALSIGSTRAIVSDGSSIGETWLRKGLYHRSLLCVAFDSPMGIRTVMLKDVFDAGRAQFNNLHTKGWQAALIFLDPQILTKEGGHRNPNH